MIKPMEIHEAEAKFVGILNVYSDNLLECFMLETNRPKGKLQGRSFLTNIDKIKL